MIHVSTGDVLGNHPGDQPTDEDAPPGPPGRCAYVITKREAEDAVMAEVARLKKEGGVPEVKSGIGEVADLQEVYTKELGKLKTAKDEQIVALAKQYDTALDKMERQLVSANELESALKVREACSASASN